MKPRTGTFAILASLIMVSPAWSQFQTPEAVVRALYEIYGVGDSGNRRSEDEDRVVARAFDRPLLRLYKRAVKSGGMSEDFFLHSQGEAYLVKPIEIVGVSISGSKARVRTLLTQQQPGETRSHQSTFIFLLIKAGDSWKLHDAFSRGESLTGDLFSQMKQGN